MVNVKIVGVPEHFNYPWHMAIADGAFSDVGIEVQFTNIPEGTGKMAQMLANNETDLAIILTEGIIKSIADGNPSKIVQCYIETPLLWGIHVAAKSNFTNLDNLKNTTAAISRYGSGSHLMAYVQAQSKNWNVNQLKFKVVNTLNNALTALESGEAHYFMWEHFTTKPLVDNGTFRRLGNCPTPWPCFVLAASANFYNNYKAVLESIFAVINSYTVDFKHIPSIHKTLANAYQQKVEDIEKWLRVTQWSQNQLSEKHLSLVQETLKNLGLIEVISPSTNFLLPLA